MKNNRERTYRNDLKEHPGFKGFFQHSHMTFIYVSRDGKVLDSISNKLFGINTDSGYGRIYCAGSLYSVHRLVVETFLVPPSDIHPSKLITNHINGIPGDDRLVNLEWTDHSGNIIHAYKTGLRFDNTPILAKDLRSGEIHRFYGLQECARFFKVGGARIHWCLKPHRVGVPHFHFFIIIQEGWEWPEGGPELIGKVKDAEMKETVVYSKKDKQFTICGTQRMAPEFSGIHEKRIREHLQRARSACKTQAEIEDFIFIRFADFSKGFYDIPKSNPDRVTRKSYVHVKTKIGKAFRKPVPIEVTTLSTGDTVRYESSEIFARKLGISKNTLQKHLWVNGGVWKSLYKVSYLS